VQTIRRAHAVQPVMPSRCRCIPPSVGCATTANSSRTLPCATTSRR
jgi:hypothetical protein